MVKCLPVFEYFTVFLKNINIIFKIRRSKVTDYAALKYQIAGIAKPCKKTQYLLNIFLRKVACIKYMLHF